MKTRGLRKKVLLRAQVRAGPTWSDACIVNISWRGLGLQAAKPPQPGTYVELRTGAYTTVARVAWAKQHRFGLQTQDSVLMSGGTEETPPRVVSVAKDPDADRKGATRLGRLMEFTGVAMAAAVAAIVLFGMVGQTLSDPKSRIVSVLGPG